MVHTQKSGRSFAIGAESVESKFLRIAPYPDLADFSTMRQKSTFRLRVDRGGHERSKSFCGCALRLPQKMGASQLVGTEQNFACAPLTSPLQGPGPGRRPGPSPGAKSQRDLRAAAPRPAPQHQASPAGGDARGDVEHPADYLESIQKHFQKLFQPIGS